MKERPILFSGEMVRAILDGRKTQTRRVVKYEFDHGGENKKPFLIAKKDKDDFVTYSEPYTLSMDYPVWFYGWGNCRWLICPHGQPGDRLYVKETHYRFGMWVKNGLTKAGKQKWKFKEYNREVCFPDAPPEGILSNRHRECLGWFIRPSLFMPRWASRILLEIVNVRVERLHDISPADALEEGYPSHCGCPKCEDEAVAWFENLWAKINGEESLDADPWVWVISFKRIQEKA